MADPKALLEERLLHAFNAVEAGADPVLRSSDRADFQANGVLALAKRHGANPTELAQTILAAADLTDLCDHVEVSGPGFINLTLSASFIASQVQEVASDPLLGLVTQDPAKTVVVDYSGPNAAKEMHVGHLRSTVIGDAMCRVLDAAGHSVIRENHIGDWGTPFGMLIEQLLLSGAGNDADTMSVADLDEFYRQARASFDSDEAFKERSRRRVVLLQSGDPETISLWRGFLAESTRHFDEIYAKLGVLLTDDDIVGESAYNDMLPEVVRDLDAMGLLVESDGAQCVFPAGFTNRAGDPLPLIIQKTDGGYSYAASDLAAIRDRVSRLHADLVLYVVGAPQSQHLEMCFAVARAAGWLPEGHDAIHVAFGNVLGADRKMFKTRSGETVRLADLLDEGVERAAAAIAERAAEGQSRDGVAVAVGIGAVKYSDLATERIRDYVFDWDRMLAFEGNTGPYLQYAHARIASIFRRSEIPAPGPGTPVTLDEHAERALGLALLGFNEAVAETLATWSPSKLCTYLFDLATTFTTFYENCPVLKAPDESTRNSRLVLSDVTARVLVRGLGLLGIEAPDQM